MHAYIQIQTRGREPVIMVLHKVLAQQRLHFATGAPITVLCFPDVLKETIPLLRLRLGSGNGVGLVPRHLRRQPHGT